MLRIYPVFTPACGMVWSRVKGLVELALGCEARSYSDDVIRQKSLRFIKFRKKKKSG